VTPDKPYVSRGGEKLAAALDAFGLDVAGWACADFGANVGGFTDCLLRCGAARVYALDTGYGTLDWRLRKDPRVVVMERTNALYATPAHPGGVNLVAIDVAFTPQRLIVPAAARWLAPGGHIVSLLKPHYEREKLAASAGQSARHVNPQAMDVEIAQQVCRAVCEELAKMGFAQQAMIQSPLLGKGGNVEFLLHLGVPVASSQ
jgi:23S rRNA (cytidine1920-2'-O)/16S rRNA (cytidine1409-2'-O)-methyltransferase